MNSSRRLILKMAMGCLLVLQLLPVVTAEVPLVAFEANYELFYGKSKAAIAQLSLTQTGDNWRWYLLTKPKGILSLLTSKEPYSETIFTRVDGNHRVQQITIADDGVKDKQLETVKFDWDGRQVEMLRKGVTSSAALSGDVYDYLSVHLLSAKMQDENLPQASVDFYKKGRLIKLELKQLPNTSVTIGEKEVDVMIFEQLLQDSRTRLIYYYDPGTPYIPMKIETLHPEKKTTTMVFVPTAQ